MDMFGAKKTAGFIRYWCAIAVLMATFCVVAFPSAFAAGASTPNGATAASPSNAVTASLEPVRDVAQWVERMHSAPCQKSYSGTFVVLAANGAMSSSRILHACDGQQQMERVESLSGMPRIIFRRNDEVRTFLPQTRSVRADRREDAGLFPRVPIVSGTSIARFYSARLLGQDRVAGFLADVVWFKPVDSLRFGYRLWSERETGLVVKLQTLGADGRVLEQAAFTELDLSSAVRVEELSRMMDATEGYKMFAPVVVKTSAQAEGWTLRQSVAGFVPVGCHRRSVSDAEDAPSVLQCLYSDGLASVSLFLEPFDAEHHPSKPQFSGMGATQLFAQHVPPDVWITAVGEVPLQTLRLFAGQLVRAR